MCVVFSDFGSGTHSQKHIYTQANRHTRVKWPPSVVAVVAQANIVCLVLWCLLASGVLGLCLSASVQFVQSSVSAIL